MRIWYLKILKTEFRKFQMFLSQTIPAPLVNWNFERLLNLRFDHEKYGLKPKHPALGYARKFIKSESLIEISELTSR